MLSAPATPSHATPAASGLRTTRSTATSSHGISAHTLDSGHANHVTIQNDSPNASPASSAPAKRIPSARASTNVPSAATNSFSAATTPSDHQYGKTYDGTLNGDRMADCISPSSGWPRPMSGFHSAT